MDNPGEVSIGFLWLRMVVQLVVRLRVVVVVVMVVVVVTAVVRREKITVVDIVF